MPQGDVGETGFGQLGLIQRQMSGVTAVGQKDLNPPVFFRMNSVQP